jgi:hypothetical protein
MFGTLRLFMTITNIFVIANGKQLRTGGSFRILLPFFRTYWGVGVLNSAIFNNFHNRVEFGTILEGLRNFEGGFEPPNSPPPLGTPLSTETGLSPQLQIAVGVPLFSITNNTAFYSGNTAKRIRILLSWRI